MAGRQTRAEGPLDARGLRIAIVAARFHEVVTSKLVEGAIACATKHGASEPAVAWVPGAFELPLACKAIVRDADAVVALGCVIRGETPHFDYVCAETARGIMQVMLDSGVPIGFGLLTTEDLEQAHARAGGAAGNKGWDAAEAAIEMASFLVNRSR